LCRGQLIRESRSLQAVSNKSNEPLIVTPVPEIK